jgi:Xaa-Pro aminopeptidase
LNNQNTERVRRRISTAELERRWKAMRLAMKESGLDFLIMQNTTAHLGGYIKWFTDLSMGHGYPATVIFPREDEMTTIWHGPRPPANPIPPAAAVRGVKTRISVPIIPSLSYSAVFDAEKAVEQLLPYGKSRIGLVGMGFISSAFYKYLSEHLNGAELVDATDLVDAIKVIKSEEEIGLMRETCRMEDSIFEYALTAVRPGRKDFQVYADIIHKCLEIGADYQNLMISSAPYGSPASISPQVSDRVIADGDQFTVLVETSGADGYWGELARTICLGKISNDLERQFEDAKKAQSVTLDLLKQGADPVAIWREHNTFLRKNGYPEEGRVYSHGQGYDLVERPSMNPGETMKIGNGMVISVHPEVISAKAFGFICDDYLVTGKGRPERLHETEQKIFVI